MSATFAAPPGSVAIVLGTRPEMIKLSHVSRLLGDAAAVVHTGQHYDATLHEHVRAGLDFPAPHVALGIGGLRRGQQVGGALTALDAWLAEHAPRVVVVQGDTNAALAGALAASANDIPLVHVEAGLRSFDRRMPEEHNRVLIDHLADRCCAPTEISAANLAAESISGDRVVLTGNTIVEVARELVPDQPQRRHLLEVLGLPRGTFVLATIHRPENTDDPARLAEVLRQLAALSAPVVLPLHPRTETRIRDAGIGSLLAGITVLEPLDPVAFLGVAAEATVWVTDSGGLQEEASILQRPVVVVRRSTERPEVQGTFAELVPEPAALGCAVEAWLGDVDRRDALRGLPCPFGDGQASARIARIVAEIATL